MPEPTAIVSAARELFSLKLDTPLTAAVSFTCWACILLGGDHRPLETVGSIGSWAGWQYPAAAMATTHDWMADPARITLMRTMFASLVFLGIVFAKFGRPAFFALLGFLGLGELDLSRTALLLALAAVLVTAVAGTWTRGGRGNHIGLTLTYQIFALLLFPAILVATFAGKNATVPIDKRMNSIGIRILR
ncbi:Uncharacterised protein [Mycobacteroides abscessus subsp. abscessus]|uniref:hypothetical protein n=1 Tax=Mycobacteroides abscessus TaxID=36809 RepID=UPI00092B66A3|nr:hypothetical protein [Mycobacteroides abscessus]SHU63683.1 Uncharacterised protein [Mycobacteroides abscessus subsp. abscessus]